MTRRPTDWRPQDSTSAVIAAGLGVIVATTLAMAVVHDRRDPAPRPDVTATPTAIDPYAYCLAASDAAGFAGEVCEPLMQGYEDPAVLLYPKHMDPGGCGTTFHGVRWCPVDLTPDKDGCLTFTYAMLYGEPQEKWGDPLDGEVFCVDQ